MTTIEWTNETWNPLRGCSLVSEGCSNCYAMAVAHRFSGKGMPYEGLTRISGGRPVWTGDVRTVPSTMALPLRWTRPRRVFVNSMSDLFHPGVPFEFIAAVFTVMAAAQRHTFQVLTKRPQRAREFFDWLEHYAQPWPVTTGLVRDAALDAVPLDGFDQEWIERSVKPHYDTPAVAWPLPNVHIGISVENQDAADDRIPLLAHIPAAVRWLSCEPLLGAIDLGEYASAIDWVVCGGESGRGARPMALAWAEGLLEQCRAAGVPFFFKQLGSTLAARLGVGGKGGEIDHIPTHLRVREYPREVKP